MNAIGGDYEGNRADITLGRLAEGVLARICDVEEAGETALAMIIGTGIGFKINLPVLILMLLINTAHKSGCRWQDLIDKDENGFLGGQLDALSDHVDELANGEICRDQVLLLVDSSNVRLLDLLADDLSIAR